MINIHYVVTDQVHTEQVIYDLAGVPCWGLIVLNTPAMVEVNGVMRRYEEHSAMLYAPGTRCHIEAINNYYSEDWIRFDCNESFLTDSFIPYATPFALPNRYYILDLFKIIAIENISEDANREFCLTQLMFVLLHKLHESSQQIASAVYPEYMRLRDEIYLYPDRNWNIDTMASRLHVSASSLHNTYQELFHISCINDVIASRISHAKELLCFSNLSVAEIAASCGYNNVEHFSRQFRKKAGISPLQFRKSKNNSIVG